MKLPRVDLVRYDAMCRAIDAAHEIDEVKEIRNKALALETYARQAINTDAERRAAEIRMRAERKAGQLLAQMPKAGGGRPTKIAGQPEKKSLHQTTLSGLGISRDQSAHWQRLGAIPVKQFEAALANGDKPSTKGLLRELQKPKERPATPEGLWLWGRLHDFDRNGLLAKSPDEVMEYMADYIKDDIHRLAPQVAKWLKQIGAPK
jgi:hypothetical protein